MYSLVVNPFSRDFMKIKIDYQPCFYFVNDLLSCIQYSHSAWFLDGRILILPTIVQAVQGYSC